MQEPTNETRANRARTALLPYHANLTQDDQLDEALVDCLTDLMHLAKQRGTSFSKALGTAKDHFREEQPRQPIDLDDTRKTPIGVW